MTIASKDNLHTARDTELQNSATPPPQFCNIKICDISANLNLNRLSDYSLGVSVSKNAFCFRASSKAVPSLIETRPLVFSISIANLRALIN